MQNEVILPKRIEAPNLFYCHLFFEKKLTAANSRRDGWPTDRGTNCQSLLFSEIESPSAVSISVGGSWNRVNDFHDIFDRTPGKLCFERVNVLFVL
jgi:hypothetical protein